ncbi:MAG: hypothetical protein ACRDOO_08105 [Actinomadura sp.]
MSTASDHPASRSAIPHIPTYHDLTHEQAFGHACIVCGRFFDDLTDQVPVGRSVTGDIVQACAMPRTCARDLGTALGDEPARAGLWAE